MDLVRDFDLKMNKLIESFEHAEKSDNLRIGGQDLFVRSFIVSVLKSMIINYEDDELYFGLAEILAELIYQLGDYGTGYGVWIGFDIDRLNEINLGVRENLEKLNELKEYYSK